MISVVIPNFNGAKFLPMCLDSFKDQTYKDFELIVVDNCSTDGSCELIREKYPEVILIPMDYNSGFSVAVNRGMAKAGGEYIALFNNDAAAEPGWLEELLKGMESDETVGICGSKILFYFQRDTIDSTGVTLYDDGVTENRGHQEKDTGQYEKREFLFGACAAAILYRRKMLEDIAVEGEIYDEDFFAYYEDADINFRAHLAGYKCLYVPSAVVYHIGSATNKRVNIKDGKPHLDQELTMEDAKPVHAGNYMFYHSARNFWNLIIKDMPGSFFWRKACKTFFYEFILYFLYSIKNGIFGMYLSTRWKLLGQISKMLKKRKIIQGRRKVDDNDVYSLMTPRTWKYYQDLFDRFFKKRINNAQS